MAYVQGLRCRECAREFAVAPIFTCEWCFGPLEVVYDYDAIAANTSRETIAQGPLSIWRYADLLPVDRDSAIDLGAGFTPLVRADRLAAELGLGEVWLKNDTRNPTNSFKDRVTAVALSKALEFGFKTVACASTGNLANSVAAHAAHAGLRSYVFIPSDLEAGKVVTTSVYGGNVVAVARQLRRRQPALCASSRARTSGRSSTSTCGPSTRRAARPSRSRPPSSSAGRRPTTSSCRSRAGRCSRRSTRASTSCTASGCSTRSRRCASRARRPRVARRWRARSPRQRHDPAGQAVDDRQVARDRQSRRRLLRARHRARHRRRLRGGVRRRDRRRDAAARAHRGCVRRDRGRRDDRHARAARRAKEWCAPTSGSSSTSPATA